VSALVVDNSVLVYVLTKAQTNDVLRQRLSAPRVLSAPHLVDYEFANALRGLVKAGKVREIGCSNFSAEQLRASEQADRLIDDLMDVARSDLGRLELQGALDDLFAEHRCRASRPCHRRLQATRSGSVPPFSWLRV
jgi:predicted nucleic acid-binding protein